MKRGIFYRTTGQLHAIRGKCCVKTWNWPTILRKFSCKKCKIFKTLQPCSLPSLTENQRAWLRERVLSRVRTSNGLTVGVLSRWPPAVLPWRRGSCCSRLLSLPVLAPRHRDVPHKQLTKSFHKVFVARVWVRVKFPSRFSELPSVSSEETDSDFGFLKIPD